MRSKRSSSASPPRAWRTRCWANAWRRDTGAVERLAAADAMRRPDRRHANHGWSFVLNDSPTQPASATARLSTLTPAALRLAQAGAEALRQQRPDVAEH